MRCHALIALLLFGCGGSPTEPASTPSGEPGSEEVARSATCPAQEPAPRVLPGTSEAHGTLAYWLERDGLDLDEVLLTPTQVQAHDHALASDRDNGMPIDRGSLAQAVAPERLQQELTQRLAYMRDKIEAGDYGDASGAPLSAEARAAFADAQASGESSVRVALETIPIRCAPRQEGLYKTPVDLAFDRNNCSSARPQEPIRVLGRWPNGMWLARTRYSLGWIDASAAMSPPLSAEDVALFADGARVRIETGATVESEGARFVAPRTTLLPTGEEQVLFADASGVHRAPTRALEAALRPLTRRAVLEEAFARIGQPYGWGGQAEGLDCSRFVMDVLETFGLELPRHSARQAASGTYTIELEGIEDADERVRMLDAAAQAGVVLLHFPGHIMMYLGRDADGTPMAIHSFSEYVEPCEGEEAETLRRVDRVAVSDLSLGAGSSRGSFLERLTKLVILGQTVGPGLIGVATPRNATAAVVPEGRACDDSLESRVFRSPQVPNPRQPLRVFITASHETGPAQITLVDPDGNTVTPETHRLGGPPFTYWAEVARPAVGRWTAVLGDGPNVTACETITVHRGRPLRQSIDPETVWEPRFRWEADTEALFSAFVEQLFNFPIEEDRTWPNLSVLLNDPAQNLLHNHFGFDEEEDIPLQPDCADLPYFLRTYFAWKMRLPFAFRSCTRGRHGRLPTCDEALRTPQWLHEENDPVRAFRRFILTQVKRGVHSASGRTHPEDDITPLYPVPMTREALTPGTVFADPYGHLLVIAQWLPQGADGYGILVGADAQPDGTVGRRRFWRGSFLFHPDTTHVGAGFKAWRPVVYNRREQTYEARPNDEITARNGYVPFSLDQYAGSADDFYEAMEGLINPRPLDPVAVQMSLIDALDESVARRVVSVNNGEAWIASNPGRTMEMPEGGAIFQTGGPWEEYSTPSRDMRLLIAMDTVVGFPEVVRRNPARFGETEASVEAAVQRVRTRQEEELAARRFTYTRSDGQDQPMTLADVVARSAGFEMSYNPNDCVEIRWAAPAGSPEMQSCRRHAPAEHRGRMDEYREWFSTRRRPIY
ncbi:MAG: C40 family peptidase [Sandaracinaceae bacterium]